MTNIIEFEGSYDDLKAKVEENNKVATIVFHATWCGPCRRLGEALPGIAKEFPTMRFIRIDIDRNEDIANKYSIRGVPAIRIVELEDDLKVVGEVTGFNLAGIKTEVSNHLPK